MLGQPHRNARGEIDNAVTILHGTGGTGRQFLSPQFADELYGPGQPLDIGRYWIILPDGIGHGKSSKPSDGLHMRFPRYDYDDMVDAQYRLLHDGLGIRHMRLIMGTSMGCMHSVVWGETHPDFVRALMPLACEPVEVAGLNRMWRKLAIDGIEADPAWAGGEYRTSPNQGLRTAASLLLSPAPRRFTFRRNTPRVRRPRRSRASGSPQRSRRPTPTTSSTSSMLREPMRPGRGWRRSRSPRRGSTRPDFINPRNLDLPERAVARMKDARFRLVPESDDTRGHGTHTAARFWKTDLVDLLQRTEEVR